METGTVGPSRYSPLVLNPNVWFNVYEDLDGP